MQFIAVLTAMALSTGCDEGGEEPLDSSARLLAETVDCNATTNVIATSGNSSASYTATLIDQGTAGVWCSFSPDFSAPELSAQAATGSSLFVYLQRNTAAEERSATIEVRFSDDIVQTLRFTQEAYSQTVDFDRAWGEQPVWKEASELTYKTYYTTIAGSRVRNYSVCFDRTRRVSQWVAYPVHACYSKYSGYEAGKSSGRTDAWAYDDWVTEYSSSSNSFNYGKYVLVERRITKPEIAEHDQAYILKGYGYSNHDRGHMLPSASRLASWTTNAQTFYATNMMPQYSKFNQSVWGKLENNVRAWAGGSESKTYDTLWVVTGASFKTTKTFDDRKGNPVAVPSHCWKVMVRLRPGVKKQLSECSADEVKAIGFLFTNDAAGAALSLRAASCPVREVEELSGFEFFRNLAPAAAEAVKSQHDPADWPGI